MENEKTQRIYRTIMLVVLTITITVIVTSILFYNNFKGNQDTKYVLMSNSKKGINSEISKLRTVIDSYYLGDIDEQELLDNALIGYVNGLNDEYSEYIPKKEMDSFSEMTMGMYEGIGIYYTKNSDNNEVTVISPIKDTPAYDAGILPGDVILKIDDEYISR